MAHASLITWYEGTPSVCTIQVKPALQSGPQHAPLDLSLLAAQVHRTSLRTVMRHRPVGIESIFSEIMY